MSEQQERDLPNPSFSEEQLRQLQEIISKSQEIKKEKSEIAKPKKPFDFWQSKKKRKKQKPKQEIKIEKNGEEFEIYEMLIEHQQICLEQDMQMEEIALSLVDLEKERLKIELNQSEFNGYCQKIDHTVNQLLTW